MEIISIIAIITIIILLTIFRRTALIIIVIGFSYYLYFSILKQKFRLVFFILISVSLIIVLSFDQINEAIEQRGGIERVNVTNIGNERRTLEMGLVINRISTESGELLFGTGNLFNDRGDYGSDGRSSRRIHGDIPALLYGVGLIGTLSVIIFIGIIIFRLLITSVPFHFKYFKYTIITVFILTLFTGGIYYLTYSSFIMFTCGYLYGRKRK